MLDKLVIHSMSPENMDDLIHISDAQLGRGYLTWKELESYGSSKNKKALITRLEGKVIGFSLLQIYQKDRSDRILLTEDAEIVDIFSDSFPVGCIHAIAVEEKLKGKGVGNELVNESLSWLKNQVKSYITIAWEKKMYVPLSSLLERNGMEALGKIKNYWFIDSAERHYFCPSCGSPPCTCNAVIYGKFL